MQVWVTGTLVTTTEKGLAIRSTRNFPSPRLGGLEREAAGTAGTARGQRNFVLGCVVPRSSLPDVPYRPRIEDEMSREEAASQPVRGRVVFSKVHGAPHTHTHTQITYHVFSPSAQESSLRKTAPSGSYDRPRRSPIGYSSTLTSHMDVKTLLTSKPAPSARAEPWEGHLGRGLAGCQGRGMLQPHACAECPFAA